MTREVASPLSFSNRFGYSQPSRPRTDVERDSDDLRLVLWDIVSDSGSSFLRAYQRLSEHSRLLPDAGIWSDRFAEEPARGLLDDLGWTQVYEILEAEYASARGKDRARIQAEVNAALARSGLAYEMRDGKFEFYEPAASEFDVRLNEDEALASLTDEFEPVRAQYEKALEKLRAVPPDFEGAVADAVNSLEAVAKISTGDLTATLSRVIPKLFPGGEGYHVPLRAAIDKLYAYANQVPGGRHGRYAEPQIAHAETVMVVRLVGALITFLVTVHRAEPMT